MNRNGADSIRSPELVMYTLRLRDAMQPHEFHFDGSKSLDIATRNEIEMERGGDKERERGRQAGRHVY